VGTTRLRAAGGGGIPAASLAGMATRGRPLASAGGRKQSLYHGFGSRCPTPEWRKGGADVR